MKGNITLFFTALCLGLTGCMAPPKGLEEERFSINSYREISPQDLTCHCKTVRLGGKSFRRLFYQVKQKLKC